MSLKHFLKWNIFSWLQTFIMMVFFTLSFPVVPWKKLKTCSDFLFCNLVKWFGKTLSVYPFYTCKMIWLTFKTFVGFFFFFFGEFKNIILVMFELQWFIIVTNIYNLTFCQYAYRFWYLGFTTLILTYFTDDSHLFDLLTQV